MTFGERLTLIIKRKKITQTELAKKISPENWDSVRTMLSQYCNDKAVPDDEMIKKIANALEVSFEYLKNGKNGNSEATFEKIASDRIVYLYEVSSVYAGYFALIVNDNNDYMKYPVQKEILPIKYHDMPYEQVIKKLYVFNIKGDSMSPTIQNKWRVVVEKCQWSYIHHDDIVIVINQDNEIIIKRFQKRNSEIFLKPDNDEYKEMQLIEGSADNIGFCYYDMTKENRYYCVGKVVNIFMMLS